MVEHHLGKVGVGVLTTASITESTRDLPRHGLQLPPVEHLASIRRSPKGMLGLYIGFIIEHLENLNEFVDRSLANGYLLGLALVCLLLAVLHVYRLFQGCLKGLVFNGLVDRRTESDFYLFQFRSIDPDVDPSEFGEFVEHFLQRLFYELHADFFWSDR